MTSWAGGRGAGVASVAGVAGAKLTSGQKPNNSRVDPRGPAPRVVVDLETQEGSSLLAQMREYERLA